MNTTELFSERQFSNLKLNQEQQKTGLRHILLPTPQVRYLLDNDVNDDNDVSIKKLNLDVKSP